MKNPPLNLADLSPQESTFTLSTKPDQPLTLCRWSLRVRAWASTKYTNQGLQEIFAKQMILEIADIAWFMLKPESRAVFENKQDNFLDSVVTIQDQINLIKALLQSVGIGEPEIEKIDATLPKESQDPKPATPVQKKPKTGAKSLTR